MHAARYVYSELHATTLRRSESSDTSVSLGDDLRRLICACVESDVYKNRHPS